MNNDLKFLTEQRAEKLEDMKKIVDLAKTEKRELTDTEIENFNKNKANADRIDASIRAFESVREEEIKIDQKNQKGDVEMNNTETPNTENSAKTEERAFANHIRGIKNSEIRSENLDLSKNGAIIPTTIANKIIEKVIEMCPIYRFSEIFHVKGNLVMPYYGDDGGENITCAYHNEFDELISHSGKFSSVELGGFLAGALTKISNSLINNNEFGDKYLVNFVVRHMSDAISRFIENELINGTGTNACQGILTGSTNVLTVATSGKITPDDLIDLQERIPDVYQGKAVWIMNHKTRTAIRKFKDTQGQYMLNPDLTSTWGYTLLGKPVYATDSIPEIESAKKCVIYGDFSGLTVNMHEDMNIQVLREKYATQHATGIVGWLELDSKITDQQKLAVLKA